MKKNKSNLWRGATAVTGFLLTLVCFLTTVANANAGGINNFLGISGASKPEGDGEMRFESAYGELSDANLEKLIADEMDYCARQLEEGSVLLKNDGVLPLGNDVKKVTLFGRASTDIQYRNSNGGGSADPNREINLKTALNNVGIEVNETLYNAYKNSGTSRVKAGDETADIGEEKASFYTDSIKKSFADYSDAAIVVLSRWGGEGTDMSTKDSEGISQLAFHKTERDMLNVIKESGKFKKIIVLINSVYPLELNWLDECGVNACLWIGNPGYYGLQGVANVLTGKANPSGRLVDTYAANSMSSAAVQNFGENRFTNASELQSYQNRYVVYQEGIYVGYKYYETRYADGILGQGNANGSAGVYESKNNSWNYADEVCYPFGYGLSYTTFDEKLDSCVYDAASDKFTAKVTVTNTGDVTGKKPVELYVSLPYTAGGVEKSAIQLVAYGKTGDLKKGESETVEITFDRYLTASYDVNARSGAGGYILDAGTYYFAIGDDAHDALNNVLAAQGASGMFDSFGNPVDGDADLVAKYELSAYDDVSYKNSSYTGNEVKNLFDDVDANYFFDEDPVKYTTRSDWQGTFPKTVVLTANDKMKDAMDEDKYDIKKGKSLDSVTYEKPAGISLADMWGVEYEDEKWTTFIQQLSIEELASVMNENYGQSALNSISKPATVTSEGSEGCSKKYLYGDQSIATGYAADTVLAATWSHEMQAEYGFFYGEDCLYCGVHTTHGPGADTHRTPFLGRTAEYFSEDSVMSYYCGYETVSAMSKKGVANNFKHFFLNDQEYDRQGIATFSNEQALREIYLRAFEGGITCDGALAIMTSYNRIGCVYTAANSAVQFDLLRGEWGFKGYTMTDYIQAGSYSVTADAIIGGTNIFGGNDRVTEIKQLVLRNKSSSGDVVLAMQESAHRVLYVYTRTSMMNGLTSDAVFEDFVAWWQIALNGIIIGIAVVTAGCLAVYVYSQYIKKEETV